MVRRTVGGVVAVAALALAGLFSASPDTASAETPNTGGVESAALTCPPGYACIIRDGQVIYRNAGNTGAIAVRGGGNVWNNGVRSPGLDHIQVTARTTFTPGWRLTVCLHYGPQNFSQPDPTISGVNSSFIITGWRWRGECGTNEDTWHRY